MTLRVPEKMQDEAAAPFFGQNGGKVVLAPWQARLKTFAIWWTGIALVFYSVYPLAYWLASQRTRFYRPFLAAELRIPFVQEWFWAYMSIYVLAILPPFFLNPPELRRLARAFMAAILVAGLCFVAFPAPVGYARALPSGEPYHTLFRVIFHFDGPLNSVPSLHVCCAALFLLALGRRSSPFLRVMWAAWFFLIVCSTMLVHQHHVLDIVAGIALALLMHYCSRRKVPLA
ncbi:MAG: phosphatase PAP2 family protein [Zoogloeaceae bacterium]|jgi:membrane-associated phospholipid phosphatase|nr:phosphatase PAP2 family protein [Zoogloeaceae bacterium]